jgi:hypothetical protein
MGWHYHVEDVMKTAEIAYKRLMASPLIARALQLAEASDAAVVEARLAAGMAKLRTSSLLIGAADLALTAGVPLAVWVGVFAAMGAPYAEAQALVRNENFQSGFSQGFVIGLLKWSWDHAVARFGKFSPGHTNVMDQSLSFVAANAYNEGLRSGYMHGRILDDATKKALLSRLKSLSPNTRAGQWTRDDQVSYVIELASAGRRINFFKAA